MRMVSVNPYTEEINGEFDTLTPERCREAVERARKAFAEWRNLSVGQRAGHIKNVARGLRAARERYGEIITGEMGKPVKQAVGEIEKCAWLCDFYAENASKLLHDEPIATEAAKSYVRFEPLGVILGIMPWNFPFWQVFRFAVPAMAAGNVCLLKHASNVPITALEIEELFRGCGFSPHIFSTLLIDSTTAQWLIEQDLVDGVSLTGSVGAGSKIGAAAGRAIKKTVLELGGSDPFIVLDDADLDKAARTGVASRTINTGQSCIAAKRIIVMEAVAEEFLARFIDYFKRLRIGDPMLEETDVGPLARKEFVEDLESQLEDARAKGAEVTYGPEIPEGNGFFARPAVLTKVRADMKVVSEEVFGPVVPVLTVKSEREAIELANSTRMGLGASIWSKDIERAERMARQMEAGFVAINDMVKSDPRLPFGGIKKSGVGRELSYFGLKEFVNVKSIVIKSE